MLKPLPPAPDQPSAASVSREFHISRDARDHYQFDVSLFSLTGNVIFANFHAARLFAQQMNEKRDVVNHPERSVQAGELNAMGLVDEILHLIIAQYRKERKPTVMEEALTYLEERVGDAAMDAVLKTFIRQFPPLVVYRDEMTVEDYLNGETEGVSNRAVTLEELLMLWLANENPASGPFLELFDDQTLEDTTAYARIPEYLEEFFAQQPPFGPENENLLDMLRSPSRTSPHSWKGQLEYIRTRWGSILGEVLYRILSSIDFLEEEQKAFFGFGPGPAEVYEFAGLAIEPENFSPDSDWMPRVVMLAKNVYVWLDQLSEQYGLAITRLDEIPNAELDRLQRGGFTALWLIGLWERSTASRQIKQMMGNPDAVASAYSITDYAVAGDLGGEPAFNVLKSRAAERGIRMASDMVPNHMGIDSHWVMDHPDWFISLPYSPFPSYSFSDPNLSRDDRVGIYLEDHYYQRTDAAVVFQRRDHWTGDTRYIYHGNDGTQMPWNDTAQLNYLNPEVREAVIQTILDVARRSPVIRFDAAMTLTKKHYQRLWFPEPGTGGDIPSRADFGLTKAEFDERMPEEFWREVVNRVAQEVPDTLLLAEAFWLMEGYFVRSLGMHRVYNSAFMNMMRDEKNAEYREVMKNTLAFDPEVLRRYVNFMNNPDERTAVDQFGKGDKYFGVCTVMATMPGLPMFGHGQIEGYAEKYGMEFRKAYWNESPDQYLVERHEREIYPLLHKRYLFAGVDDFYLYDLINPDGYVDENVFAYSNRVGNQRSLVLYHNRYGDTRGWIRMSAPYAVRGEGGEKTLVHTSLSEALDVVGDPNRFLVFRNTVDGLEYIRNCRELAEQGLYVELYAYQAYVLVDFRELQDNEEQHYAQLSTYLRGRGVPSIDEALKELYLQPVHSPLRMLVSGPAFTWLSAQTAPEPEAIDGEMVDEVYQKMLDLLTSILQIVPEEETSTGYSPEAIANQVTEKLIWALALPGVLDNAAPKKDSPGYASVASFILDAWDPKDWTMWSSLFGWLFTHRLGGLVETLGAEEISRSWFDEWLFHKPVEQAMDELEVSKSEQQRVLVTIRMLLTYRGWALTDADVLRKDDAFRMLRRALAYQEVRAFLGINRYQDVLWFHGESFERWLWWIACLTVLETAGDTGVQALVSRLSAVHQLIARLQKAQEVAQYSVEKLLRAAKD